MQRRRNSAGVRQTKNLNNGRCMTMRPYEMQISCTCTSIWIQYHFWNLTGPMIIFHQFIKHRNFWRRYFPHHLHIYVINRDILLWPGVSGRHYERRLFRQLRHSFRFLWSKRRQNSVVPVKGGQMADVIQRYRWVSLKKCLTLTNEFIIPYKVKSS